MIRIVFVAVLAAFAVDSAMAGAAAATGVVLVRCVADVGVMDPAEGEAGGFIARSCPFAWARCAATSASDGAITCLVSGVVVAA